MKRPSLHWPSIEPASPHAPASPLWRRLAWMAGLWLASTTALVLVALVIRWMLKG
jgi:hypothetical protein